MTIRTLNALLLAGVLSLAAASAALAAGNAGAGGGDVRSHASAAPTCGDQCPVLATEGAPSNPGDHNGRSSAALSQGGGRLVSGRNIHGNV